MGLHLCYRAQEFLIVFVSIMLAETESSALKVDGACQAISCYAAASSEYQ